jgi:hypothetical protein
MRERSPRAERHAPREVRPSLDLSNVGKLAPYCYHIRIGINFSVVHDSGKLLKGCFRVSDMPVTFLAEAARTRRDRLLGRLGYRVLRLEAALVEQQPELAAI